MILPVCPFNRVGNFFADITNQNILLLGQLKVVYLSPCFRDAEMPASLDYCWKWYICLHVSEMLKCLPALITAERGISVSMFQRCWNACQPWLLLKVVYLPPCFRDAEMPASLDYCWKWYICVSMFQRCWNACQPWLLLKGVYLSPCFRDAEMPASLDYCWKWYICVSMFQRCWNACQPWLLLKVVYLCLHVSEMLKCLPALITAESGISVSPCFRDAEMPASLDYCWKWYICVSMFQRCWNACQPWLLLKVVYLCLHVSEMLKCLPALITVESMFVLCSSSSTLHKCKLCSPETFL